MIKRNRRPAEPGRILKEYYLKPRGLSINKFAQAAGLTRKHVSNIVNGKAGITPETVVRFAQVLDTTAQYWFNLQNAVSLFDAQENLASWKPGEIHPADIVPA
ncbi:MAG: HigA family addiction module antitoxin [Rhodospirillales bacterium]|nr:HigA family addiction module antitoxin [Rhodospirillales bacterium]